MIVDGTGVGARLGAEVRRSGGWAKRSPGNFVGDEVRTSDFSGLDLTHNPLD